tara:strand:- start:2709 stop:3170 length:462 start_codon:yes stop_codon:yes gene_type:complete
MAAIPFILRLLAVALGLGFAQWTSDAVSFDSGISFGFAILLLSLIITLLKPVLVILMLPFVVLTLGIGLWVVNALLVALTSKIIPGFIIAGWGGAFWTALWVSIFTIAAMTITGKRDQHFGRVVIRKPGFGRSGTSHTKIPSKSKKDDDVIDI